MQHGEEERLFPVFTVEGWADFGTNQCEEIHRLFLELDQLEGPLIFHCRGGFGRTGTFAVCWKIYQELKSAWEQRNTVEIDPVAIIDEMRFARTGTVQNIEQFEMILNYVDYLNRLHVQDAF